MPHIRGKLQKASVLVRRFGLVQAGLLLVPELTRMTRLWGFLNRLLGRSSRRFLMRDRTVIWLRPFSMDLGVFHEIWDHKRYANGAVGRVAMHGTVVDIGAHIGLFSLYSSKVLHAKRLVSVEPDVTNFELLSKNINSNMIQNATLVGGAVSATTGEKKIYRNSSNTGGHSFYIQSDSSLIVSSLSLADLFVKSGVEECSLLKMDCEGAEIEILDAAPNELLRRVRAIAMEYHLDRYPMERLEELEKRLKDLGFVLEATPTTRTLGILRGIMHC